MELRYKVYSSRYGLYTIFNKHKVFLIGLVISLFLFAGFSFMQIFAAGQATAPTITDPTSSVAVSVPSYTIKGDTSDASGTIAIYKDVNNNGAVDVPDDTIVNSTDDLGGGHFSVSVSLDSGANNFLAIYERPGKDPSNPADIPTISYEITTDTTSPDTPTHISPTDGAFRTTSTQALIDWSDVSDPSSPVKYQYESSHSPATNPDGSFTSPVYTSGILSSSEIPTPGTPEGVYYWHVKAIDDAGNESDWSSAWTLTVDNTKPATTWDETGPITTNNPTIAGNTTDNLSGVDIVQLQIENGSGVVQPWTVTNIVPTDGTFDSNDEDFSASPATSLPDGTYTFKARATDKSGNVESTAIIEVTIDTAAPGKPTWNGLFKGHNSNVANFIPCGGFTNITQVRFDWNTNPESDIAYYWFGTKFNTKHKKVISPTYYDGNMTPGNNPYYYTIIAVDEAGNESEISNQCGLTLDQVAPIVTVTPLAGGGTLHGTVTFDITVTDDNLDPSILNNIWTYLYNSAPPQKQKGAGVDLSTGHGTFTVNTKLLDDGSAVLDVGKLYDAAGNPSGTGDTYFTGYTIDNTASDGVFISPTSLDLAKDEFTIEVEISDPSGLGSQQIVMRDTGGAVVGNWSYNVKTDVSNTISGPIGTFSYTGDDFSGNLEITFDTSDLSSDGQYNLRLFTKDALGNGRSNIYSSMLVDNTEPATTWDDGASITTSESSPIFTGNATDNLSGIANVQLRIEDGSGGEVQDYTSTGVVATDGAFDNELDEAFSASPESPLGDGTYTFFARSIDAAGNIESTAIMAVTVDTTPTPTQNNSSNNNSSGDNSNNGNSISTLSTNPVFSTFGTFGANIPAGNVLSANDNNNENEEENDGREVQADTAAVSSASTAVGAIQSSWWSWWWILPIIAALLLLLALWRRREDEEDA